MVFDLDPNAAGGSMQNTNDGATTKNRESGTTARERRGATAIYRRTIPTTQGAPSLGLRVDRVFTVDPSGNALDPFEMVSWVERSTKITNPDGTVVFEFEGVEVPDSWSQVAVDILSSKYLRKAGVPVLDENGSSVLDEEGKPKTTHERSAREVIFRMVRCWRHWGESYGYFASNEDSQSFEDELAYMLLHQVAAPNSPQWFNTGLHQVYGLTGPPQGHFYVDPTTEELRVSDDA